MIELARIGHVHKLTQLPETLGNENSTLSRKNSRLYYTCNN